MKKIFLLHKWGFIKVPKAICSQPNTVWLLVETAGELMQIKNTLTFLKHKSPNITIVLSTGDPEAFKYCKKIKEINFLFYTPHDVSFLLKPLLQKIRPKIMIAVEYTSHPNLIALTRQSNIPTVLLSATSTLPRYVLPSYLANYLSIYYVKYFETILAQDAQGVIGFSKHPLPHSQVLSGGNFRFDFTSTPSPLLQKYKKILNINQKNFHILFASVHKSEFEDAIKAFMTVRKDIPNLKCTFVPRYLNERPLLENALSKRGLTFSTKNNHSHPDSTDPSCIIWNGFGQLTDLYALSDICYLGGSLSAKYKGHNLAQPIASGTPVIFGSYMGQKTIWENIVKELVHLYPRCAVSNASSLSKSLKTLLTNPKVRDHYVAGLQRISKNQSLAIEQAKGLLSSIIENRLL